MAFFWKFIKVLGCSGSTSGRAITLRSLLRSLGLTRWQRNILINTLFNVFTFRSMKKLVYIIICVIVAPLLLSGSKYISYCPPELFIKKQCAILTSAMMDIGYKSTIEKVLSNDTISLNMITTYCNSNQTLYRVKMRPRDLLYADEVLNIFMRLLSYTKDQTDTLLISDEGVAGDLKRDVVLPYYYSLRPLQEDWFNSHPTSDTDTLAFIRHWCDSIFSIPPVNYRARFCFRNFKLL